MQTGQRWIIGLLVVIALLLAALIFLDVSESDGDEAAGNAAIAENVVEPVGNAIPAAPDGADPIDAAVDNILAADAAGAVAVRVSTIPRPFWGLWTRNPDLCGKPEADDSAIEIAARKLSFWESSGEVKSVALEGPLSIEVEAGFTGEGEAWDATARYTLSPSKQDLMIANAEGRTLRYKRCG